MEHADLLHWYERYRPYQEEDVIQEAACVALEARQTPVKLFRYLVGYYGRVGYRDTGLRPDQKRHTWQRESVSPTDWQPGTPLWAIPTHTPERLAIARDALRRVPLWVIELHLTDDLVCRNPCQHDRAEWYPYRYDYPTHRMLIVKCRACLRERMRARRARMKENAWP